MRKFFLVLSCIVAFSACQKEQLLTGDTPEASPKDHGKGFYVTPNNVFLFIDYEDIDNWEELEADYFSNINSLDGARDPGTLYEGQYCQLPSGCSGAKCIYKENGGCAVASACAYCYNCPQPEGC